MSETDSLFGVLGTHVPVLGSWQTLDWLPGMHVLARVSEPAVERASCYDGMFSFGVIDAEQFVPESS